LTIDQITIEKAIDDLFKSALKKLNDKMINVFIPLGNIAENSPTQVQTFAFEDELAELTDYLSEYSTLLTNQFNNKPKQKARLFIQMYCKIMENDFQYLIIYNMLRLMKDLGPDWEFKTTKNGKPFYCQNSTQKIDEISPLCKPYNLTIGTVLKNLFKADLRNSYCHTQYTILPNGSFVNTRFYSPTFQGKPKKKVYQLHEIENLYGLAESFFDIFFRRFFVERKKFKTGEEYELYDGRKTRWESKSKRWKIYKKRTLTFPTYKYRVLS
jgi:hypothetical protein